ncbi:MAG: 2-C-methyl-D-erythritol 2,4-cyclodiphosphate synthase [Trueperaceae bacterium]|nr:2-C-methyl-D-erythritol 2,4-cyclodiphosphate synthase [Trueperaceae bacterium]
MLEKLRIGFGEDAHALSTGRSLVIGNVVIEEAEQGALAHSDGDVLLHALSDALLSAFAMGDIGHYFPPSNPAFKDMDSSEILVKLLEQIHQDHETFDLHNVAAVVTLDKPKLGKYRDQIRARVAELLGLEPARMGLTFKTSEGLASGHIQARVTLLLSVS